MSVSLYEEYTYVQKIERVRNRPEIAFIKEYRISKSIVYKYNSSGNFSASNVTKDSDLVCYKVCFAINERFRECSGNVKSCQFARTFSRTATAAVTKLNLKPLNIQKINQNKLTETNEKVK